MNKDERRALFGRWFSDNIPHNKALGIEVLDVSRGMASMRLAWRPELVGNPETGVLAGGPVTAMLDACCGMAVASMLDAPRPFATLDLRIDYVRPAVPGEPVIAEAECYRLTRSVAFTRAFAHQGDPKDPVAAAAGTFMMGTKGRPPSTGTGR
ncbi:MAG: PaaI family thioesterase [Alphaproteobacteria bacterium]|nr:PaaI family thioesterase [Alphaproteobacteria bacterium]